MKINKIGKLLLINLGLIVNSMEDQYLQRLENSIKNWHQINNLILEEYSENQYKKFYSDIEEIFKSSGYAINSEEYEKNINYNINRLNNNLELIVENILVSKKFFNSFPNHKENIINLINDNCNKKNYNYKETIEKLAEILEEKKLEVFHILLNLDGNNQNILENLFEIINDKNKLEIIINEEKNIINILKNINKISKNIKDISFESIMLNKITKGITDYWNVILSENKINQLSDKNKTEFLIKIFKSFNEYPIESIEKMFNYMLENILYINDDDLKNEIKAEKIINHICMRPENFKKEYKEL